MRLLLTCVTEGAPEWLDRVESLLISVRGLGGRLAGAPFVVSVVGDPDPESWARLERHGARVRPVAAIAGNGMANKIRMLELAAEEDFDVLVGLDCDVVVVDDCSERIPASAVGAKPADHGRLGDRDWERLYATVGLAAPAKTLRATSTGRAIPPYFNSGVITVPKEMCEPLMGAWSECYALVSAAIERDPDWLPRNLHWLAEQSSFALAVARAGLPYEALPIALNYPTHVEVHSSAVTAGDAPAILHYHREVDSDGFLLSPREPAAAAAADGFNALRAERLGLAYDGLRARSARDRIGRGVERRMRAALGSRQRVRSLVRDLRP